MLLQTNSYIVPKERRAEHARLLRRFRQTLLRLGCDHFEVYEQVGANWSNAESSGRYVQILRFKDRKQQLAVQNAERGDATAQAVIAEFCDLINFPYQQQQGLFAVGFYTSVLPAAPKRMMRELEETVEHSVVDDESGAESEYSADAEFDADGEGFDGNGEGGEHAEVGGSGESGASDEPIVAPQFGAAAEPEEEEIPAHNPFIDGTLVERDAPSPEGAAEGDPHDGSVPVRTAEHSNVEPAGESGEADLPSIDFADLEADDEAEGEPKPAHRHPGGHLN